MKKFAPNTPFNTRGFTLVEVLVAATISLFAVVAATAITIEGMKIYFQDSNRLSTNHDMRRFTQIMATDAVFANAAYIYPDFNTLTDNGKDAYLQDGQNGQAGDFLVLVSNSTDSTGTTTVTNIAGYYRVPDKTTNFGPVYRFSIPVSIPAATSITTMLNNNLTAIQKASTVFLSSVQGTATPGLSTEPNALFYNYNTTAIMVKAVIQDTSNKNQISSRDTYNLTISPRG